MLILLHFFAYAFFKISLAGKVPFLFIVACKDFFSINLAAFHKKLLITFGLNLIKVLYTYKT